MFRNDYSCIAHPKILQALLDNAKQENIGYGVDQHTKNAEKLILDYFGVNGKVHILTGGTQTNMVVISYFLKPYQAVIACESGHINVHETGAIEASGHKVLTGKAVDGKLPASEVERIVKMHGDEHMVDPAMVYISNSTETGTVYHKDELLALREVCDKYGLLLYIDGARLACALCSKEADYDAKFFGSIADIFYIGGTKNGCLNGEAIVLKDELIADDFRYHIKNRGALNSKGFVLGIEFETLFTDDLFCEIGRHSNQMADYVVDGLKNKVEFLPSSTNQHFMILDKKVGQDIIEKFGCELWEDLGDKLVVRAVTSFATTKEQCDELIAYFN